MSASVSEVLRLAQHYLVSEPFISSEGLITALAFARAEARGPPGGLWYMFKALGNKNVFKWLDDGRTLDEQLSLLERAAAIAEIPVLIKALNQTAAKYLFTAALPADQTA